MSNSTSLLIHRLIKGFADATIKVFIPLLIYKATGDLFLTFLFAFLTYAFESLSYLIFKKFIQKHGVLAIILHIVPLVVLEFMLSVKVVLWVIVLMAILHGISSALYAGAINTMFASLDHNTNVAKFDSGEKLGKIIFTIVSAFILGMIDQAQIFMVIFSFILYLVSIIPLCMKYQELKNCVVALQPINQKEVFKANKWFNVFFMMQGFFNFTVNVGFPVYLYVTGLNFTIVGVMTALKDVIVIVSNFVSKWLSEKNQNKLVIILTTIVQSIAMIAIILLRNSFAIYIVSLLIVCASQILFVAILKLYTTKQREMDCNMHTMIDREGVLSASRSVTGALYMISPLFMFMFGLGSVTAIGLMITGLKCLKMNNKEKSNAIL